MDRIAIFIRQRLSRVTSQGIFISEIDGLRFIAIMAVVGYHSCYGIFLQHAASPGPFWQAIQTQMMKGHFGVRLFFVISGFILGLPFAEQHLGAGRKVSLGNYFLRRLTRLEPTYLINLLLWLLCWRYVRHTGFFELAPHFLASAAYVHNLAYGVPSLINGVAWSLEIEVQFYVLVPLLTALFAIPSVLLRRLLMVSIMVLLPALLPGAFELSLAGHLQYFIAGFLLVDVYLTDWNKQPQRGLLWDLIGLAGWLFIVRDIGLQGTRAAEITLPFAVLAAYIGAFRGVVLNRLFTDYRITTVGGMCYTIYLYHWAWIYIMGRVFFGMGLPEIQPFPLRFVVLSLALIGGAVLSAVPLYILFERPFMSKDWPRRLKAAVWRT